MKFNAHAQNATGLDGVAGTWEWDHMPDLRFLGSSPELPWIVLQFCGERIMLMSSIQVFAKSIPIIRPYCESPGST